MNRFQFTGQDDVCLNYQHGWFIFWVHIFKWLCTGHRSQYYCNSHGVMNVMCCLGYFWGSFCRQWTWSMSRPLGGRNLSYSTLHWYNSFLTLHKLYNLQKLVNTLLWVEGVNLPVCSLKAHKRSGFQLVRIAPRNVEITLFMCMLICTLNCISFSSDQSAPAHRRPCYRKYLLHALSAWLTKTWIMLQNVFKKIIVYLWPKLKFKKIIKPGCCLRTQVFGYLFYLDNIVQSTFLWWHAFSHDAVWVTFK